MGDWWDRTKRMAGNAAAYGLAPVTGGASLLGKQNVRNVAGDFLSDPVGTVGKAWEWASGAQDTQKALDAQMQAAGQAGGAITGAYQQGQGLLAPYQQGGGQNFQDYSAMVRNGGFTPQYSSYQGQTQAGQQFTPQYQGYSGQMSSGNPLPQYQQFGGATQYQAGARPERQMATAQNVNMFMDPGYQFRMNQGLNAIQSSAAAKGLLGSSATLNGIQDYAQGLASQEFGNAYNRFSNAQNQQQGDFEADRAFGQGNFQDARNFGYGMNRDLNTWNAQNADRGQAWFEGDRAAGLQNNQFQNNFGLQAGQMGLNAFNQDRAFGYGMNQDLNNWNMINANNNANLWGGLVDMGYGAATAGANLAGQYGMSMAGLYGDMGNAQANSILNRSQQNRGLLRDAVGLGFAAYGG